ncbi:aminoacyl-tRNA hydrolase [Rhodohalobacter sp. SW132]|uniref:aminoacyl-tRNA hydrolase n=1 Tax=Rhodohalobacter sp. SW132 TaxID=2293433 RepID=UPI000E26DCFF|nr:aminoacyl-tRNA hydrolase [Rhodohalobacter sp. SW132]REL29206.1 aminoacyl-tRNA hydrolase [Rhodohalobacter sp. SW132]
MSLIVGLGNIGSRFEGTRHNIGFELADKLARELSVSFRTDGGPFLIAEGSFKGKPVHIIKPTTLMNLSGRAVSSALALTGSRLEDCLVCYDDINLPPGKIRLRPSGSAGGHNGIQNIIDRMQSREFPRLRIGIGDDFSRGRQSDYVLGQFTSVQREEVDRALEDSVEAVFTFLRAGIDMAMNHHNS